jgi:hypothetical protein
MNDETKPPHPPTSEDLLLQKSREQIKKQMTDYIINVLEEKRPEFSGFAVCPFIKADRVADQLHLDIFDNTRESLLDVLRRFTSSGKRSALIAQPNEDVKGTETREYQKFINVVLDESGNGAVTALCFNPKDKLEIGGYNPRSKAPCFLINLAYGDHLSKSHRALQGTNYYDKFPATYKKYLNIK